MYPDPQAQALPNPEEDQQPAAEVASLPEVDGPDVKQEIPDDYPDTQEF